MLLSVLRRTAWLALGVALLLPAGCGRKKAIKVYGKVTYDGQPVESGIISFFPEDGNGPSAGSRIAKGDYVVADVTPGKNRVQIVIARRSETAGTATGTGTGTEKPARSRRAANEQRLSQLKKGMASGHHKQPADDRPIEGNFAVDVTGSQRLDFPMEKVLGKK